MDPAEAEKIIKEKVNERRAFSRFPSFALATPSSLALISPYPFSSRLRFLYCVTICARQVAVFEKRKWARPVVEKTLQMWVHKRRYKVIVAEHRQKLEEERRRKEEEERKERERLAREAEETRLAEEADARRREEEDKKKHAEAAEAAALAKKAEEHHCSVAEEQKAEQNAVQVAGRNAQQSAKQHA